MALEASGAWLRLFAESERSAQKELQALSEICLEAGDANLVFLFFFCVELCGFCLWHGGGRDRLHSVCATRVAETGCILFVPRGLAETGCILFVRGRGWRRQAAFCLCDRGGGGSLHSVCATADWRQAALADRLHSVCATGAETGCVLFVPGVAETGFVLYIFRDSVPRVCLCHGAGGDRLHSVCATGVVETGFVMYICPRGWRTGCILFLPWGWRRQALSCVFFVILCHGFVCATAVAETGCILSVPRGWRRLFFRMFFS